MIFREDLVEPSSRCVWFETDEDAATLASFGVEADGLHVGQIDGNWVDSEPALLAGLASALSFPEWPADLDALRRGLYDLGWLRAVPVAVGVRHAEVVWRRAPRTAGVLVEHWLSAAEHWAARGRALHLLFFWGPDARR